MTAVPTMRRRPAGPADLPEFSPPAVGPEAVAPEPYVAAHVEHLMGMPISIHVRGPRPRAAGVVAAVQAAYADLAWVDATFSTWKPDSQLSRLRRGDLTIEQCCPEFAQVLDLCAASAEETNGAFAYVLPDADSGEWLLDPTGLVKGWAIARAAELLAGASAMRDHAYCLNAGGDIAVGGIDGSPGGSRPWRLGIENPDVPGQIAHVVELGQGGLATSGCAARGAHLVDPGTGTRTLRRGSVSVIAPDIVAADVWATALFVGPPDLEDRLAGRDGWQVIRL